MSGLRRLAEVWELARLGAPLRIGPTGELALALYHRWKPSELFVILTAYLDEAGTDGRHGFVVVGGWVSTVLKWNDFDLRWRKLLGKKGLSYFHAMDYKPDREPYKSWTDEETAAFFGAMERLLLKRTLFGFVAKLDLADYQEHYVGPGRIKGVQLDSKYGVCLRLALSLIYSTLSEHVSGDFRVNVVLEAGDKSIGAGDAIRVFNQLKDHVPEVGAHLGTISFGKKRDFPGLQAADSMVSPAHRLERKEDVDIIPYVEGETLATARGQVKGAPVYRIDIDARLLKELRENLATWKEMRRAFWRDGSSEPSEAKP